MVVDRGENFGREVIGKGEMVGLLRSTKIEM